MMHCTALWRFCKRWVHDLGVCANARTSTRPIFSFFFHVLSPSYFPPLFDYDRFLFYLYSFLWILQTRFLYARLLKTHLMSCMYGYTCRFII
jgi:hypothetical protein